VMSTHGRGGLDRLVHGSVVDYVLRHASTPIVVVPAGSDRDWEHGRPLRILVPLDGSVYSEEAICHAVELAHSVPAELWLLQAVEERLGIDTLGFGYAKPVSNADLESARDYLEQAAALPRQSGLIVHSIVRAGQPADEIRTLVEQELIDLVVMATHGEGGLGRFLAKRLTAVVSAGRIPVHIGSVAAASIQHLKVPALLVHPLSTHEAGTLAAPTAATAQ
jgi:nucleotide-binding universal stress UspA family protein